MHRRLDRRANRRIFANATIRKGIAMSPDRPVPVLPETRRFSLPDGEMSALVWPRPGATRIVFLHGNGFNAGVYRQMLGLLAAQYEIVAPDLRGHGATTLPADPARHRDWHVYAHDIIAMLDQLDSRPFVLAGHSMGGVAALLTAEKLTGKPLGLALIDPVILRRTKDTAAQELLRDQSHPALACDVAAFSAGAGGAQAW